MTDTIFEAAGGSAGLLALAHAWHERCLADPVVSHAFSHGFHPDHSARLAVYWAEALGGPSDYSGGIGDESSVLRLHAGNGEHHEMDRRAQVCFDQALEDVGLAADPRVREALSGYFRWATAAVSAYAESPDDVPPGLSIPRWSWDGPVG